MDYLSPLLKRILNVTAEFQDLAAVVQNVIKTSDSTSADIEQFMTDLEAAHQANLKAYQAGVKVSQSQSRASAEIARLQSMPISVERLADAGTMGMIIQEVTHQNYIEAALMLGQLDMALYALMFKELSTYDEWKEKRAAIQAALDENV